MIILHVLTGAGLIILVGYIAEFIFKKLFIPDVLFLIFIGYLISPGVFGLIDPKTLGMSASIFTTFTLLFLLFVGALHIELHSFLRGIGSGSFIGFMNFLISAIVIATVFMLFKFDFLMSLMFGCALGGISSAFVIPVITQLGLFESDEELYTILTLESAITDVFSIIFTLSMMELIIIRTVNPKAIAMQILAQLGIAALIGITVAVISCFAEGTLYESDRYYMMTIAALLLTYSITEYLGGNGAIAVLFTGLMLNNSKYVFKARNAVISFFSKEKPPLRPDTVSKREKLFYDEISFFLKTFFFVYIGMLLNFSSFRVILIAFIASAVILGARQFGAKFLGPKYDMYQHQLVASVYARGLAPAVLMQIAVEKGVITDSSAVDVVYLVIALTILFSSIQIFIFKKKANSQVTESV
ncbi:MAG: cation:proton antiporter [Acidobacteria bacterium]|nr:cation:proton antiporter [Acidobacteriota bacterium]